MKAVKKNDYRIEALGQLSGIPITKAIEILTRTLVDRKLCSTGDYFDAAKLGIEALKNIEAYRLWPKFKVGAQLPGETVEKATGG